MNVRRSIGLMIGRVAARFLAAEPSRNRSTIANPVQSATRDITALTRRELIAKSRYFYDNSPTFSGIVDRLVSYVVGTGLHVAPNTSSHEFNVDAARAWREWCELPEFSSDDNFITLESQLVRSIFVDGDVFVLKTFDETGAPKIQLVESHRITDLGFYGIDMPDGVKIDAFGRPLSYSYATTEDATKFVNIPAQAVVRMNLSKRVNQYRGVPLASSALMTVHDISDIVVLEKQAVKFGSSFIGSMTRESGEVDDPMSGQKIFEASGETDSEETQEEKDRKRAAYYEKAVNARLIVGTEGQKIDLKNIDRPGPAWQGFMQFLLDGLCLSTGLTPNVLLGTKVGGADTRASLASATRVIEPWQNRICDQLQSVYEYVIESAILRGDIRAERPADWWKSVWQHPPKLTVDAGRESQQAREDVKAGLLSRTRYFSALGLDAYEELETSAKEAAYIKALSADYGIPTTAIDINLKETPPAAALGSVPAQARLAARCKPGQCVHKWAQGGSGKSGGSKNQSKYGKLANKLVKSSEAMRRINNAKGETITASDGKPAIFNAQSIKHVVGDHNISEGRKRMSEIYFAQDTTATGISFKSLNKGRRQTEFIKEYDTGNGKKYFYTARREDNNVVYSWHEITRGNYDKKEKVWKR